jgi:hypothetical protein
MWHDTGTHFVDLARTERGIVKLVKLLEGQTALVFNGAALADGLNTVMIETALYEGALEVSHAASADIVGLFTNAKSNQFDHPIFDRSPSHEATW